jgi:hypothetical protein
MFGSKLTKFSQDIIKNEPMLFSCDAKAAYDLGGPITRDFLNHMLTFDKLDNLIFDSRVHMLMPGWFPCIPGFHHDDVPREREDLQPNYINPSYKSNHCLALYGGEIAPTEFAIGEAEFSDIPLGQKCYKIWHKEVEEKIEQRILEKVKAPSEQIVYFDWNTWHQGVRAVGNGWRFFIRASWNTNRKPTNEIRRQVQVYLEKPMEGW